MLLNKYTILAQQVLNEISKYNELAKAKNYSCLNISWLKSQLGINSQQWAELKAGSRKIGYVAYQHALGLIKQAHYNLEQQPQKRGFVPSNPSEVKHVISGKDITPAQSAHLSKRTNKNTHQQTKFKQNNFRHKHNTHESKQFKQQHESQLKGFLANHPPVASFSVEKPHKKHTKNNARMNAFLKKYKKQRQHKNPQKQNEPIYEITLITAQKHHKNRFNVYLNGKYSFPISATVWAKYRLSQGSKITPSLRDKIIYSDNTSKLYDVAMNFLARRLRTEQEIRTKLEDKGGVPEAINHVVKILKSYHLIDDEYYASAYVQTQVSLKKFGPNKIKHYLKRKGIKDNLIADVLDKYYPKSDAIKNGIRHAQHQFKRYSRDSFSRAVQKVKMNLIRKGFTFEQTNTIVDKAHLKPNHKLQHRQIMMKAKDAYQRYYRSKPYQRKMKTKAYLYRQGYSFDAINNAMDKLLENN